jgi:hypothetical protein
MELTLFFSKENNVIYCNVRFENVLAKKLCSFFSSTCTVRKSVPLLHKVGLHCKIIAACNIRHSSAVSGVIKHLGTLKMYFSARKIHIFVTPLSYSTMLTRRREKWKYGNSGETGKKIPCLLHESQTLPLQLQENIFLSVNGRNQTLVS